MTCTSEFNVVRRRHHCRGCGKVMMQSLPDTMSHASQVVCGTCSDQTAPLTYNNNKPGRVCILCHDQYMHQLAEHSGTCQ